MYSIYFDGPDVDQQKIGQLVAGDRDSECDPNGATDLRFNNLNGERVVVETISEGTPLGGHGRASEIRTPGSSEEVLRGTARSAFVTRESFFKVRACQQKLLGQASHPSQV